MFLNMMRRMFKKSKKDPAPHVGTTGFESQRGAPQTPSRLPERHVWKIWQKNCWTKLMGRMSFAVLKMRRRLSYPPHLHQLKHHKALGAIPLLPRLPVLQYPPQPYP